MASMSTEDDGFRLNAASLPKLDARGENFAEWKSAWSLAFRVQSMYEYITSTKPPPTVSDPSFNT